MQTVKVKVKCIYKAHLKTTHVDQSAVINSEKDAAEAIIYSFSQLLTHKKRKFGTIYTTFTSCTNRSTQFGTTSHSLICIRL